MRLDQIGAQLEVLTKQFSAMGGANGSYRQPYSHFLEEDDECIVE
jgi:hypothetical protein